MCVEMSRKPNIITLIRVAHIPHDGNCLVVLSDDNIS